MVEIIISIPKNTLIIFGILLGFIIATEVADLIFKLLTRRLEKRL